MQLAKLTRVSKTNVKAPKKEKLKSSVLGREARVSELERWTEDNLVRYAKKLGMKNVQWKNKQMGKNRSKKEISDLIYFKEIEFDL